MLIPVSLPVLFLVLHNLIPKNGNDKKTLMNHIAFNAHMYYYLSQNNKPHFELIIFL